MAWIQRADNCRLYYEVHGEGNPLLLLHGNGEDGTYFQHQITYFEKYYQVIIMDMRGHGKSMMGKKDLDFELFATDVIALLDEQHIEKAHVLGFSDGGNTAMMLGIHYPKRFFSLILNGANRNTKGIKPHIQLPIVLGYKILSLFHSKEAKHKQQVMGLMVHHPHISLEEIKQIPLPVLVLVGDHDMVKDAHSRELAMTLSHAQLTVLHGSHFIAQKNPEEYNESVLVFLKSVESVL